MPPVIAPTSSALRLVAGHAVSPQETLGEDAARREARERGMANHPAGRRRAGGGGPAMSPPVARLVAVGAREA
jgi:hypothetical protein